MTQSTAQVAAPIRVNGLDTDAMTATIEALQKDAATARFQFRATNRWIDGGENRSRIKEFYGTGEEDTTCSAAWEFVNGEPPVLLGANEGANPVEFLLHALAGCVTTTTILHATARGITIRRLRTELEGDIDLQGFLGLDPNVSPGYEAIRIRMDIEADCSDAQLDELLNIARNHSPICTTGCRPVPVTLERVQRQ